MKVICLLIYAFVNIKEVLSLITVDSKDRFSLFVNLSLGIELRHLARNMLKSSCKRRDKLNHLKLKFPNRACCSVEHLGW